MKVSCSGDLLECLEWAGVGLFTAAFPQKTASRGMHEKPDEKLTILGNDINVGRVKMVGWTAHSSVHLWLSSPSLLSLSLSLSLSLTVTLSLALVSEHLCAQKKTFQERVGVRKDN